MKRALLLPLLALTASVALMSSAAYAESHLTAAGPPEGARPAAVPGHAGARAAMPAQETGDDDGPDILRTALITIGVVGGAAALTTLAFLLRVRIGYEPHRPREEDEGGGGH